MSAPRRRPVVQRALLAALGFYSRAISPAFPPRCRFYPSCSAYAAEAVAAHGAARGSWLSLRRILKCAPWHPGGVDLVPSPRPGTSRPRRSSSRAEPPSATSIMTAHRPVRAVPPVPHGAPREENSVA